MARHLIRNSTTGEQRIVGDAGLAFFPGYAIVDTLEDGQPPSVFYGAGESDLRYVNVTELSDPESPASTALRAALGLGVRPEDHGAAGDGTTDDTAAFTAAIAATASAPRALILTPGKKYRLTSSVAIDPADVRAIYGNNALVIADGNFTAFAVTGSHVGTANPTSTMAERDAEHHFIVRDLHLKGPATSGANITQGVGLSITGTQGVTVTGCMIREIGTGIRIHGDNRNVIISESSVYNARYGLHIDGGDIHQLIIRGNHISYCDKALYALNAETYNVNVVGNDFEADPTAFAGAGSNLIHIENTNSSSQDWLFSGNQIEDHFFLSGPAVKLVTGSGSNSAVFAFAGNYFGNNAAGSIHATNPKAMTVTGNIFRACQGWAVQVSGEANGVTVANNVVDGAQRIATVTTAISGLCRLDLTAGSRHNAKITGNIIRDFWGQVVDVNVGAVMVSLDISDNDIYVYNTAVPAALTEGLIDVSGASSVNNLSVSRNRMLGRANTPKGVVVSLGGIALGIIRENLAAGPTAGSAHTLPAASASRIVADNLGWVTTL